MLNLFVIECGYKNSLTWNRHGHFYAVEHSKWDWHLLCPVDQRALSMHTRELFSCFGYLAMIQSIHLSLHLGLVWKIHGKILDPVTWLSKHINKTIKNNGSDKWFCQRYREAIRFVFIPWICCPGWYWSVVAITSYGNVPNGWVLDCPWFGWLKRSGLTPIWNE